jgi:hypothetical protein
MPAWKSLATFGSVQPFCVDDEIVRLIDWKIEEIWEYLEPGKSSRLALCTFRECFDYNFILLDVMTGQVKCQFPLLNVFFPACWHGGNFLFSKALQPVPKEKSRVWYEPPHYDGYDGDIQEQCFGFTLICI